MRMLLKCAVAAAVLAAPVGAMSDEEGDVKYRQAIMKAISGHAGAIAQIAKGKVSHTSALQGHAINLLELTKQVQSAFQNETLAGKTTATAKIWSDADGFKSKAEDMEKAAIVVADAARSGPNAVAAKLGDLFETCKGCHKGYRVKKK